MAELDYVEAVRGELRLHLVEAAPSGRRRRRVYPLLRAILLTEAVALLVWLGAARFSPAGSLERGIAVGLIQVVGLVLHAPRRRRRPREVFMPPSWVHQHRTGAVR